MAAKRIRIELFPNSSFRKYHVTAQLSSEQLRGGLLGGDRYNPFRQMSFGEVQTELSEDTKVTVMRFYDIEGVQSVGLDARLVEVTHDAAYDWSDLEDDIITTVKEVVGWTEDEVTIDYLFFGEVFDYEPVDEIKAEIERQRIQSMQERSMF